MDKELIDKINYYSRKKREQGLTEQEQIEQNEVRQKYLSQFRCQFKEMLENIEIVDDNKVGENNDN